MSTLEQELPATLDEQQQNVVQMQKLQRLTIEPGVMRLPVARVSTHDDSPKWIIDLEHPVEGEIRFHRDKPVQGYDPDEGIVQLMRWYDIHDDNPYKLQTEYIYVRYAGADSDTVHDWELLNPDYQREEEATTKEQVYEHVRNARSWLPNRTLAAAYLLHLLVPPTITGAMIAAADGFTAGQGLAIALMMTLVFVGTTVMMVMVTEPER